MATLAAAMIVKDEERFLGGCLRSILPFVDEVVVVDTGSTDRTCEIARSMGARLIERQWPGNFAEARNWALDAASCDWILYIDADERLVVPPDVNLKKMLDTPRAAAFMVRFSARVGYTPYAEVRLFRNDPRIRFNSVIHEQVHSAIRDVCASDGLRVLQSSVRMVHLGYEGDLTHKYQRNIPLLRQAIETYPDRVYLWHDLGMSLFGVGETEEALTVLRKGANIGLQSSDRKQRADAACAIAVHATFQLFLERDALPTVEEGLQHFPDNRSLQVAKAHALIRAGRSGEALPMLDKILREDPDSFYDPYIGYDRRIFGEYAHDLKGLAYLRLGRFAEAAESYEAAYSAAPDEMAYRVKAVAARAQAAKASRDAAAGAAATSPRSASAA